MITIKVEDQKVLEALSRLAQRTTPAGMAPVMQEIGEVLAESTKQRFATSTAPDGSRWAPLAERTILARLSEKNGVVAKKTGKLTKKGSDTVMGMKPLVATEELANTILYQVINGGAGVDVGTNRFADEWEAGVAVHQFGSRDGTIPARPFLGLSTSDKTEVLDILQRFIDQPLK